MAVRKITKTDFESQKMAISTYEMRRAMKGERHRKLAPVVLLQVGVYRHSRALWANHWDIVYAQISLDCLHGRHLESFGLHINLVRNLRTSDRTRHGPRRCDQLDDINFISLPCAAAS